MGQNIDQEHFDEEDYRRYGERLQEGLNALRELLERPGFGEGPVSLGAELEMFLVDESGYPFLGNEKVLADCGDDRVTVELNKFNLECNLRPHPIAGRPFEALRQESEQVLETVRAAAGSNGGRVVMVGILPTLREDDLKSTVMTDTPRFRALSRGVRRLRQGSFDIRIDGEEPLTYFSDDVTVEGANTGFQIHLRVPPRDFCDTYNAVQLATPVALAVSGNSPIFLARRLWRETRIALFKQAVDERHHSWEAWRPARVSFGNGWVREGAFELFAETVALHAPLLPIVGDESPLECLRSGGVPKLEEVRLHHGTVWRWNRGVYDPKDEGHLRVEMRSLPAGPSVIDMLANSAYLMGLALGLRGEMDWMATSLPWKHAEHNFYRAAQHGLGATLLWPSREPPSPRPVQAVELVYDLLPVARRGLVEAGIEPDEADALLEVIRERSESGITGSEWQLRTLAHFDEKLSRDRALVAMLETYLRGQRSGEPVHRWPLEPA